MSDDTTALIRILLRTDAYYSKRITLIAMCEELLVHITVAPKHFVAFETVYFQFVCIMHAYYHSSHGLARVAPLLRKMARDVAYFHRHDYADNLDLTNMMFKLYLVYAKVSGVNVPMELIEAAALKQLVVSVNQH